MHQKLNFFQIFKRFLQFESTSGILLLIFAFLAIVFSNSSLSLSYQKFWSFSFLGLSCLHWVNEGWMTLFFLMVGLEIKREGIQGTLSTRQKASLPLVAALGGMVFPALIYQSLNQGLETQVGWGIPMATDIAFAVGVLSLFGKKMNPALKVFLLALAIADDLGAVLVIAVAYTQKIHELFLILACGFGGLLLGLNRYKVEDPKVYLLLGVPLWFCFLKSGIHSTVAGVVLALLMPLPVGHRLESALKVWVAGCVLPVFAFANAGVSFLTVNLFERVSAGIILGLVLGKPLGITLFSWLAVQLKIATLPEKVSWRQLVSVSFLGGIGFTMSIFIADLAFGNSPWVHSAKVAIFVASVISTLLGALVLSFSFRNIKNKIDAKI